MIRPYRRPPPWTTDQDNFVRASIGQLSDAQIAEHLQRIFNVNRTISAIESRRWKLMSLGDESVRRGARMSGERAADYVPSPEDIAAGCTEIQSHWSKREEHNRIACDKARSQAEGATTAEFQSERFSAIGISYKPTTDSK